MYIEASPPNAKDDTARLISPHMSYGQSTITCWTFFYHMSGQNVGSLELLVSYRDFPQFIALPVCSNIHVYTYMYQLAW